MIKIENTCVSGWEAAIRGMRNAMNSWDKSDTQFINFEEGEYYTIAGEFGPFYQGEVHDGVNVYFGTNDIKLMKQLASAGSDHAKFRRMINVTVDITAPRYWATELDTYKVGTVRNSCSTMHKIADKEFTIDDFSHEHLFAMKDIEIPDVDPETFTDVWLRKQYDDTPVVFRSTDRDDIYFSPTGILELTIESLNKCREMYLKTKDKRYWWQMIQLLPQSYNQKFTWQANYEVLHNIYHARKNHKLSEWHDFCDWIEELPLAKEVII